MAKIERSNRARRIHVPALAWGTDMGTDFWLIPEGEQVTAGSLLSDRGWTTTSLVETAGTGADFLSSSDVGNPPHYLTNAASDLLQSPAIFGDYIHGEQAASILGYSPTQLIVEFYAAMTVHSADEAATTGWGLVEAGGTAGTAADRMAWISTDATNFWLRSAADTDAGATDDANWHLFRIEVATGSVTDAITWYIDGTSQGTIDRQTDLWPVSFGMFASTTNRPALSWIHAWYA